jgi:hypothetical protein
MRPSRSCWGERPAVVRDQVRDALHVDRVGVEEQGPVGIACSRVDAQCPAYAPALVGGREVRNREAPRLEADVGADVPEIDPVAAGDAIDA